MPEREQDHVDEERQQDDRPAVVADVVVHPLEGPEQRHHDHGEHAEIDRARKVAIERAQDVEVLGPGEEFDRRVGAWRFDRERDQIAGRILGTVRWRNGHRRKRNLYLLRRQRGDHEVVVVYAGILKLAVICRLLRDVFDREANDFAALEQDPFRLLDSAAELGDIADRRSPDNQRRDCLVILGDDRAKREDVRRGVEVEILDHMNPGTVAVLEVEIDRRSCRQ